MAIIKANFFRTLYEKFTAPHPRRMFEEGDIVTLKINGKKAMIVEDRRWMDGGNVRYPELVIRLEDLSLHKVDSYEIEIIEK